MTKVDLKNDESIYNNCIPKMINLVFEDLNASADYEDTKAYIDLMEKTDELIDDDEKNTLAHELAFEASRQFFILGFLKAMEMGGIAR